MSGSRFPAQYLIGWIRKRILTFGYYYGQVISQMMTVMMMMIILEDGLLYHQTPYRINSFFQIMIHIFMNFTPHLHASILDFFRILRKRLRCYIVLFFRSFDPSSLVGAALLLYIWIFCRIFPSNYVFNKPLYIALYTLYIIHTHTSKCGINAIPILELNHEWDLQMTVYCTGILFWRKETQGKIYT